MSLRCRPLSPIPDETARVARAAFPPDNTYLALRDQLGTLFTDDDFAALYPRRGRPAVAPWRLALITVFQFIENLSGRQPTPSAPASTGSTPSASRPHMAPASACTGRCGC